MDVLAFAVGAHRHIRQPEPEASCRAARTQTVIVGKTAMRWSNGHRGKGRRDSARSATTISVNPIIWCTIFTHVNVRGSGSGSMLTTFARPDGCGDEKCTALVKMVSGGCSCQSLFCVNKRERTQMHVVNVKKGVFPCNPTISFTFSRLSKYLIEENRFASFFRVFVPFFNVPQSTDRLYCFYLWASFSVYISVSILVFSMVVLKRYRIFCRRQKFIDKKKRIQSGASSQASAQLACVGKPTTMPNREPPTDCQPFLFSSSSRSQALCERLLAIVFHRPWPPDMLVWFEHRTQGRYLHASLVLGTSFWIFRNESQSTLINWRWMEEMRQHQPLSPANTIHDWNAFRLFSVDRHV